MLNHIHLESAGQASSHDIFENIQDTWHLEAKQEGKNFFYINEVAPNQYITIIVALGSRSLPSVRVTFPERSLVLFAALKVSLSGRIRDLHYHIRQAGNRIARGIQENRPWQLAL